MKKRKTQTTFNPKDVVVGQWEFLASGAIRCGFVFITSLPHIPHRYRPDVLRAISEAHKYGIDSKAAEIRAVLGIRSRDDDEEA